MTEGSIDDGNYLVRVRAQVMTRDDSTGGWVPLGSGGLSNVSVRKRSVLSDDDTKHEYLIYGKRIKDQTVVLSCTIKRDFQYNKVMPTFHHWRTGDKKFGLTFQTAADARAFDKGVKMAVEDLMDGQSFSFHRDLDAGDDDVFMQLELPVERGDSRSSSGSSGGGGCGARPSSVTPTQSSVDLVSSSPYTHPHANHHHLHRMHYINRPQRTTTPSSLNGSNGSNSLGRNGGSIARTPEDAWNKSDQLSVVATRDKDPPLNKDDKIEIIQGEPYTYVQFARDRPSVHEYSYPMMDALKGGDKMDPVCSLKKQTLDVTYSQPPLLPTKSKNKKDRRKDKKHKHLLMERSRCRYCHEMFSEDGNDSGTCEYAPDRARTCIDLVTCISCAQCMLYHCMSDTEGDFSHHPCSCQGSDGKCGRRWVGLALLSLFVPCLWFYPLLRSCHKCGVGCGACGGRHEAS